MKKYLLFLLFCFCLSTIWVSANDKIESLGCIDSNPLALDTTFFHYQNDTLYITNVNKEFCGSPKLKMSVQRTGDSISIQVTDTSSIISLCDCSFGYRIKYYFPDMEASKGYKIKLNNDYFAKEGKTLVSYLMNSLKWVILEGGYGFGTDNITYIQKGDTIIKGLLYSKIYFFKTSINPISKSIENGPLVYYTSMRDLNGKWYMTRENFQDEILLYDFNLKKNDSINIIGVRYAPDRILFCVNIDTINLAGEKYKRLSMSLSKENQVNEYWIEGVGSTRGIFTRGEYIADLGTELLCFHSNEQLIYSSELSENCSYLRLSVPQYTKNEGKVQYNAALQEIKIIGNENQYSFEVYGLNGQLLFCGKQLFGDYVFSSSAFPDLFIVKYQSSEESYIVKIVR